MRRITGSRPSPAIVVAVAALVAALAGTALAGPGASDSALTKSKARKVANKQIDKRLPIDTAELGDAAVTTPKLANGAVIASKLGGIVTRTSGDIPLADASENSGEVSCQTGERLLGGGFNFAVFSDDLNVLSSRPSIPGQEGSADAPIDQPLTQWRVSARNPTGGTGATSFKVWAVCMTNVATAGAGSTSDGSADADGGPAQP